MSEVLWWSGLGGDGVSVSYPKTNIHADLSPDGTNQGGGGGRGEVVGGRRLEGTVSRVSSQLYLDSDG
jgi:hypothetical protein